MVVSVTAPMLSPFCRPKLVNALVPKLEFPYVLVWSLAVTVNDAGVILALVKAEVPVNV